MKCPLCNLDLVMTERQEIEIDYCPKCRGVWLDRSELDKIIDRSMGGSTAPEPHHSGYDAPYYPGHGEEYHPQKKERHSFLGDLFDFD
jgi:Zn-finger nucleic acid-binding protein